MAAGAAAGAVTPPAQITLGGVALSSARPRLAAPFWRAASPARLSEWRRQGLDIAEIRLDLAALRDLAAARRLCAAFADMPVILTARAAAEGGQWRGGEAKRRDWLCALLPLCDAVDIELSAAEILPAVAARARELKKAVIISRHIFDAAAPLLPEEERARAVAAGGDIFKYAAVCADEAALDALTAFAAAARAAGDLRVVIGMDAGGDNPHARRARLGLAAAGSCMAFAAPPAESEAAAPGQLPLSQMAAPGSVFAQSRAADARA